MKKFILVFALIISAPVFADTYVRGYIKDDGTYVSPHYRSDRNNSQYDNYSNNYKSGLGDYDPKRPQVDNSYRLDKPFETKQNSNIFVYE
jgi:hypothetical protein